MKCWMSSAVISLTQRAEVDQYTESGVALGYKRGLGASVVGTGKGLDMQMKQSRSLSGWGSYRTAFPRRFGHSFGCAR
jgi:hypothetical protein